MTKWTYDRIFHVPSIKNLGNVPADVLVAYKPIKGIGADSLNDYYGWVRMVVWMPQGKPVTAVTAHVNLSSNELYEVVKARLQGFENGQSIYLVDYTKAEQAAQGAFKARPGEDPWAESQIAPPSILTAEDVALRQSRGKVPALSGGRAGGTRASTT